MLTIARHSLPSTIELKQGWAENIPFPDGAFDVVLSCNVLHYIRDPLVALQDILRVVPAADARVLFNLTYEASRSKFPV
jgi:ubiquinone/menaquinone biosynthesis C-methylase UbiE